MKVYTGTGDGGNTSLFSGERLKKNNLRVASYGEVDELCSFIGVVGAILPDGKEQKKIAKELQQIQADLFAIGALLATSPASADAELLAPVSAEKVLALENIIDVMQAELTELHSFILPGGHPSSAWAQVVRAVCRRVERIIISLDEQEGCLHGQTIITYINRLSDYFFVLARYLNRLSGTAEILWHG